MIWETQVAVTQSPRQLSRFPVTVQVQAYFWSLRVCWNPTCCALLFSLHLPPAQHLSLRPWTCQGTRRAQHQSLPDHVVSAAHVRKNTPASQAREWNHKGREPSLCRPCVCLKTRAPKSYKFQKHPAFLANPGWSASPQAAMIKSMVHLRCQPLHTLGSPPPAVLSARLVCLPVPRGLEIYHWPTPVSVLPPPALPDHSFLQGLGRLSHCLPGSPEISGDPFVTVHMSTEP